MMKFNLLLDKKPDFEDEILLVRWQTNKIKNNPDKYRFLNKSSIFDFLHGSKEIYPFKFRIIRIMILVNNYEVLVKNDSFTNDNDTIQEWIYSPYNSWGHFWHKVSSLSHMTILVIRCYVQLVLKCYCMNPCWNTFQGTRTPMGTCVHLRKEI